MSSIMNTSDMAQTAQDLQEQAQETTARWQEKAKTTAKNASEVADRYVHENVWTTVTAAALAGCVLGFLMGRVRH
jgi:ElaB/YqjD/DUF883 family membrane-anchored ribosome-binding protein